jgi:hypothetical protein
MSDRWESPLTMLVIDDDERYVDALFRDARRAGIRLLHAGSLEEGRMVVEGADGAGICGVILDVECYKRREDATPDSSFIIAATKYFTEKAPHLPVVALTGVQALFERYVKDFAGIWEVYKKGRDEAAMLTRLRERAMELEWVKVVGRYPDIFRVVDSYLGADTRQSLIDSLLTMDDGTPARIRGNLANLRSIQEKLYIVLHRHRPDMVPRRFVYYEQGDQPLKSVNVAAILEHLKGNFDMRSQQVQGQIFLHYRSPLYRFSELVYRVSSDGIHAIDGDSTDQPTRYTVQAVANALLELILWFGRVVM